MTWILQSQFSPCTGNYCTDLTSALVSHFLVSAFALQVCRHIWAFSEVKSIILSCSQWRKQRSVPLVKSKSMTLLFFFFCSNLFTKVKHLQMWQVQTDLFTFNNLAINLWRCFNWGCTAVNPIHTLHWNRLSYLMYSRIIAEFTAGVCFERCIHDSLLNLLYCATEASGWRIL